MKKILFLFTVCLIFLTTRVSFAEDLERTLEYFTNLLNDQIMFILKLQTCTPARNEMTGEVIHGLTKKGCHYSYKATLGSDIVRRDCYMPMNVAKGLSTTAHDVFDYHETNPDIAKERYEQHIEIWKVAQDYCTTRKK